MENIDLFDRYINGELSPKEKEEFDARLKTDRNLRSEFRIYSTAVVGICREAEQDNKDFGEALKRISKDDLLSIIGERKKDHKAVEEAVSDKLSSAARPKNTLQTPMHQKSAKGMTFKKWLWWQSIGVAALLGLGVIYVVIVRNETNSYKREALARNTEAMNKLDDAIYQLAYLEETFSRGSRGGEVEISSMSEEQLTNLIPKLESDFKGLTDERDIAEAGNELVMIYIRLHQRDKAKALLSDLIAKFKNNPDYQWDVENWQTILNLLQ